ENRISGTFFMMIFHYSIINTCKGMKKRALCPLSGVHLTIKPKYALRISNTLFLCYYLRVSKTLLTCK
ncbi:hypothetical protein, partial [Prevotella pallens]